MAETSFPEHLSPGTLIELADLNELVQFENEIAPHIRPNYNPGQWAARPNIRDLILPDKFYGRIGDIALIVMADPYERFMDANERGWHFRGRGQHNAARGANSQTIDKYLGLKFHGTAQTTDKGAVGSIDAELYYFPYSQSVRKAGTVTKQTKRYQPIYGPEKVYKSTSTARKDFIYDRGTDVSGTIKRAVTKPHYEEDKFTELLEHSRRIGFSILKYQLQHAISRPMQN